jgi:hypothetical protein
MPTQHPPEEIYATGVRLWNDWMEMWNGRPELARTIVADCFTLHLPTPALAKQETIVGPAEVEKWVAAHRAKFRRLTFDPGCGPFVDVTAGVAAGPWFADASLDGSPKPVCGMDTIVFVHGKITEYWTISKEVDQVGRWVTRAQ